MATQAEYREFLRGKNCILVGPAAYLEGGSLGAWIDSFDLVIRVNWGAPVPRGLEEGYGSRTDILYKRLLKLGHLDEIEVKEYEEAGIQWVVAIDRLPEKTPNMVHFVKALEGSSLKWVTGAKTRSQLRSLLQTSPLAGVITIQDLLRYPIASLTVTGHDFYQTGYHTGYGGRRYRESMGRKEGHPGKTHDIPKQLAYLQKLLKEEPRLKLDDTLSEILQREETKKVLRDVAIVIPARIGSSRFPGKPLALINGKPMIVHVCERASQVGAEVVVATDSQEIADVVGNAGFKSIMTSEAATGTDRVAQAAAKLKQSLIINVQGDEPLINPDYIRRLIKAKRDNRDCVIGAVAPLERDPSDRSVVKVAYDEETSLLHWASREPIGEWQQVGMYAFYRKELSEFSKSSWKLEAKESVEILRFLKLGYKVKMVRLEDSGIPVDLPEHIGEVEAILNGKA